MYKFTGFGTKANNAINFAVLAAEQMGHTYVGSEHLLLGLLRESTGAAAMLMGQKGLRYEDIAAKVMEKVGKGTLSTLSPGDLTTRCKRILENALRTRAVLVVLAHNHPSGVALPSGEDKASTEIVREALDNMGVRLVDHFIIADNDYISMAESGFLL